ncbi:hypothetical protein HY29_17465 [Hyphomonas beringensis]|uniref:Uncharacterized protein n=1 Tax=Hyphomonas beringensis TaxID=1280946 RepID=A0A062U649_9PROT|nr:hypothetical protein HY29_17465 [Hyphomonas beringensis]
MGDNILNLPEDFALQRLTASARNFLARCNALHILSNSFASTKKLFEVVCYLRVDTFDVFHAHRCFPQ